MVRQQKKEKTQSTVGIGVCCWIDNDEQLPELKRCLDSLTSFYPVIVINGKWHDIDGDNPRSTRKANDMIDSYSNVIHIQSPNRPEYINRNLYYRIAMLFDLDYLIPVDTDEWVEMPLGVEFFLNGLNNDKLDITSCLHYYSERHGGVSKQRRLFKYPGFLRHRNRHNRLYFLDREVLQTGTLYAPRGIVIYSDKNYRSKQREEKMSLRNKDNPIH